MVSGRDNESRIAKPQAGRDDRAQSRYERLVIFVKVNGMYGWQVGPHKPPHRFVRAYHFGGEKRRRHEENFDSHRAPE